MKPTSGLVKRAKKQNVRVSCLIRVSHSTEPWKGLRRGGCSSSQTVCTSVKLVCVWERPKPAKRWHGHWDWHWRIWRPGLQSSSSRKEWSDLNNSLGGETEPTLQSPNSTETLTYTQQDAGQSTEAAREESLGFHSVWWLPGYWILPQWLALQKSWGFGSCLPAQMPPVCPAMHLSYGPLCNGTVLWWLSPKL